MTENSVRGSFRDPDGFVFTRDGSLFRQINQSYKESYDRLVDSGLYRRLVEEDLLIPHEEADPALGLNASAYKVLKPEAVPFISYPYEWSFSQIKAAAAATLSIQKRALEAGLCLKDASAYNIQFVRGKPKLIDTSSFAPYKEGIPWVAYAQFCRHFLAPLALTAYTDVRLIQLMRVHIDGIPLDLAAKLLPWSTRLRLPLLVHIHLHSRSQKRFADGIPNEMRTRHPMSLRAMLGLIDNLASGVDRLRWIPEEGVWAGYYVDSSYDAGGLEEKRRIVSTFLDDITGSSLWDLGANTGMFSRIAAEKGFQTIAWDADPQCVEICYQEACRNNKTNLLPLVLDLSNPSPAIGWENEERLSLSERGPADVVMALALVHHLAIANNVPLDRVAEFLARVGRRLIIEFVPKEDPMVQKLLSTREDIFSDYNRDRFEGAFSEYFTTDRMEPEAHSGRAIYLMTRR